MIVALTGPNAFAIAKKQAELEQAFVAEHGKAGVEVISAAQFDPTNLATTLTGATLFASSRFVVIKDLEGQPLFAEALLSLLPAIPDDVQVVLVESKLDKRTALYKTLKKDAQLLEFAELDEPAAVRWVVDLVQAEGGTIEPEIAQLLVRSAGTNQLRLTHEIQKLVAYNPQVSREHIESLVEKNPEDTVFMLLEHALSGRRDQALIVLENLERAHEDPFQLANMLVWQTHILAVVSSARDVPDAEVAKDFKLNPFVVKKTRALAKQRSKQALAHTLDVIAELDEMLKSSGTNPWRLLEIAIIRL